MRLTRAPATSNPVRDTISALAGHILIPTTLLFASVLDASAQPAPSAGPSGPWGNVSWQVEAGRDTVALRDIARTGRPVDASPVSWRGDVPSVLFRHTRPKGSCLHRFGFSAAHAGHFVLKTPLEPLPRPTSDASSRLEVRYEYRRYLFSSVGAPGRLATSRTTSGRILSRKAF